jgi:hypothetical protein
VTAAIFRQMNCSRSAGACKGARFCLLGSFGLVMPGLDPGIHLYLSESLEKKMDCRVKPAMTTVAM